MEFVYTVPRARLFPEFYPQGLLPFGTGPGRFELAVLERALAAHGFFVERAVAERTPEWKQVIPYSLVECDGRVLLVRRLATGGDARLFDRYSIGIGGHINPQDLASGGEDGGRRDPVEAGTRRELAEELDIRGRYEVSRVGLINDDSNSVGAVHVGLVQVVRVQGSVEIAERDRLEGRLVEPAELQRLLAAGTGFETWSALLIDRLDELITQPLAVLS